MSDNTVYWVWLQGALRQGTGLVPRLLKLYSSAEAIYRLSEKELSLLGLPSRARAALANKSLAAAQAAIHQMEELNGWMLTLQSPGYPDGLRELYSPPLVLYGKGTLPSFTKRPVIGMVGTRECTPYGSKAAGGMAAGLAAAGCPIISGGARGIDRAAHEGALYGGGVTVAVQACGLDKAYPAVNRKLRRSILENGGALISEYPPKTVASASFFPVRNRLISGLSWGVCVVEAPKRSGALITARAARDQGKDVFVVPGEITASTCEGSNALLQEGAIPATSPAAILREYQWRCGNTLNEEEAAIAQQAYYAYLEHQTPPVTLPQAEPAPAAEEAASPLSALPDYASPAVQAVYAALSETPCNAEELCAKTGLSTGELFSALTELEIYGCIRNHPGQHYSI